MVLWGFILQILQACLYDGIVRDHTLVDDAIYLCQNRHSSRWGGGSGSDSTGGCPENTSTVKPAIYDI